MPIEADLRAENRDIQVTKGEIMRKILVALIMIFVFSGMAWGEDKAMEEKKTIAGESHVSKEQSKNTLQFTLDGRLLLNGKQVKEFDHPELKAILGDIAQSLRENSRAGWYVKQINYLLGEMTRLHEELETCRAIKRQPD